MDIADKDVFSSLCKVLLDITVATKEFRFVPESPESIETYIKCFPFILNFSNFCLKTLSWMCLLTDYWGSLLTDLEQFPQLRELGLRKCSIVKGFHYFKKGDKTIYLFFLPLKLAVRM